ncbi:UvrD-helicase domain-containing protein [candidate division KSB1 bacterium]
MNELRDREERLGAVTTFDQNVVVVAGAGTGKTALLIERAVHLLFRKENPAEISTMALITFTKRAAAEMRERLRSTLRVLRDLSDEGEGGGGEEASPYLRGLQRYIKERYGHSNFEMIKRAGGAIDALDSAEIATIHSFCARLLRNYPLQSGVDPEFREDEGFDFDNLFDDRWLDFLSRLHRAEPQILDDWRFCIERFGSEPIKALTRSVCDESLPLDELESLLESGEIFKPDSGWLESLIADARAIVSGFTGERKIETFTRKALEILESIQAGDPAGETVELAGQISGSRPSTVKGIDRDTYKSCTEIIDSAVRLGSFDPEAQQRALRAVLPFARDFRDFYVRSGFLSFNALLVRARDLLRDNPDVRRRLKTRYSHLLVDEFQDTDPLQYEIVFFLAESEDAQALTWDDVQLQPGKLFIVGDPKQSIYSFRRADIEAYHQVVNRVVDEEPRRLSVNFRSNQRVIEAVNGLFSHLIQAQEAIQPEYAPLDPGPYEREETNGRAVEIKLAASGEGGLSAAELTDLEAGEIARWLSGEVIGKETINLPEGGVGPVRPGHVALLLRKMTAVSAYINAFREYGIDFVVEGERTFFTTQEVSDFINLLRSIDDPQDKSALVGLLRSPLGGLTDLEIYQLASAGGLDYEAKIDSRIPPDLAHLDGLYRTLGKLHRDVYRLPLSAALEEICDKLPVLESGALVAGEQGLQNLYKIISMASELENRPDITFKGLLAWLRANADRVDAEGESPLVEEDIDAVRILTIHKAKGLEFPVVILPGLHAGVAAREEPVKISRDWRSGGWSVNLNGSMNPEAVRQLQHSKRLQEAESRRLFYVGATRAREKLVLWAAVPQRKQGFLGLLEDVFGLDLESDGLVPLELEGLTIARHLIRSRGEPKSKPSPDGPAGIEIDAEEIIRRWTERRELYDRISSQKLHMRPSDSDEQNRRGEADDGRQTGVSRAGFLGSLVHGALAATDFNRESAAVETVVEGELLSMEVPDELKSQVEAIGEEAVALLKNFFDSETFDLIAEARILGREVPCLTRADPEIDEYGAVEGFADLVIEDEQGIAVVDYKTERIESDEVEEKANSYLPQGRLYARALQGTLGRPVDRFIVLFIRPAVAVTLNLKT